jgi:hypothetical protein
MDQCIEGAFHRRITQDGIREENGRRTDRYDLNFAVEKSVKNELHIAIQKRIFHRFSVLCYNNADEHSHLFIDNPQKRKNNTCH